jgi:hypothetical protein
MIRLKSHVKGCVDYKPPFPCVVTMNDAAFQAALDSGDLNAAIESAYPYASYLTSRYLYQFRWVTNESDEIFSTAILSMVETIHDHKKYEGKNLVPIMLVKAQRKVEEYLNKLHCVVDYSLTTMYLNLKRGRANPVSVELK